MYTHGGRIYLSDFLEEAAGKPPRQFLGGKFNAFASNFKIYQNHVAAKARITNIINIARSTKTGARSIELAAANGLSLAFGAGFERGYGNLRGEPGVVKVSSKEPEDQAANILIHELSHNQQSGNIVRVFGDSQHFNAQAKGFADTAYPALLEEADAFVSQTIHAYEMYLQGTPGPWTLQRFSYGYKPSAEALLSQMKRGGDLYSVTTRSAIFDAWMKVSPYRYSYETQYLKEILTKPSIWMRLHKPGLTHKNKDLIRIIDTPDGERSINLVLTKQPYLGLWEGIGIEDIEPTLRMAIASTNLSRHLFDALEAIELLEDYVSGRNQWKDLPKGYDAKSLIESGGLINFRKSMDAIKDVIEQDPEIFNILPDAKKTINDLLRRASALSEQHPSVDPPSLNMVPIC